MKLLFFVTEDWHFYSHRLPLAIAAKEVGYEVLVVTRVRSHGSQIKESGLKIIPLELSRSGTCLIREIQVILRLVSIYRTEHPDIVHHVTLKPILYGAIASYIARVPFVVNAMTGLGFLFNSRSFKVRVARRLVMLAFRIVFSRHQNRVILQNADDLKLILDSGIVKKERIALIRGSGVDTQEFSVQPKPFGVPIVLLASRLLWDKGVGEFVEAARKLTKRKVYARFVLVGEVDVENPTAISDGQLNAWREEGVVEVWGQREDMPNVFAQSHIVCLPSFHEGVPKVLIEAASCGRPIVATNVPGCREIVQDGLNGFLVPLRDVNALAEALNKLIDSPELCQKMGKSGREIVEKSFSLDKVNSETLALYEELVFCVGY